MSHTTQKPWTYLSTSSQCWALSADEFIVQQSKAKWYEGGVWRHAGKQTHCPSHMRITSRRTPAHMFCFSLCYLTWFSLCLRRPSLNPMDFIHLCVNRITTEETFCLRWALGPSLDFCSAERLHMWSFPQASYGIHMLTRYRQESSEHEINAYFIYPDETGPSVFMLKIWYILFSLLRLHNRPWLISRQQVYEPVLAWTFGWMHSLIQRCCVASFSFSPSPSPRR